MNLVLRETCEGPEARHISAVESLLWLRRKGWDEGVCKHGGRQLLLGFAEENSRYVRLPGLTVGKPGAPGLPC